MELQGNQLVGFETVRSDSDSYHGIDAATGDVLEPAYFDATAAEIDRALSLATEAHRILKTLDRERRAAFLEAIADGLLDAGNALLERAARETALPNQRLVGERGRTAGQLRMFAKLVREGSWVDARIDHAIPDREPLPKPDVRQMKIGVGPVVVFGASNFPLAFSVAGGDTASAFAAGCPVVVKAHPNHPGTSEIAGRIIVDAAKACELPEGTFSLIHGRSIDVGRMLVMHPQTKAVGFTGSLRGGKALFDLAATRDEPIPVYAEMGSTNPVFVLPEAMRARGAAIADALSKSVTMGVGQFCTNPGVVVAPEGADTETFVGELRRHLGEAPAGTMLHSGVRDAYRDGFRRWAAIDGVAVTAASSAGDNQVNAAVFETDVATYLASAELRDELFGPATLVVKCPTPEAVRELAASMAGQLTATIHADGDDGETHRDLIELLEDRVGRIVFNSYPTGVEVCDSIHHGGPFPATTDSRTTSVGTAAVTRFSRPICYQDFPQGLLPPELQDDNPLGILRLVDGEWTRE